MDVGRRYHGSDTPGQGELQGFNVRYTRPDGTTVDHSQDTPGLSGRIARNDFTSLQEAIDVAEAHPGADAISRTRDGRFHLNVVRHPSDDNAVVFGPRVARSNTENLQMIRTQAEHGQLDATSLFLARTLIDAEPTDAHLALGRQIQSAMRHRPSPALASETLLVRDFQTMMAEYQPLPGSRVRDGHFENIDAMLRDLHQVDGLNGTDGDLERCGAASAVSAAVIRGPRSVTALAQQFHVSLDAERLRPVDLHRLMEAIYDARSSGVFGQPTGMTAGQVAEVMQTATGRGSGRPVQPFMIDFSEMAANRPMVVLVSAAQNQRNDHFVTIWRDPGPDGRYHVYDPDPPANHPSSTYEFQHASQIQEYLDQRSWDVTYTDASFTTRTAPRSVIVVGSR